MTIPNPLLLKRPLCNQGAALKRCETGGVKNQRKLQSWGQRGGEGGEHKRFLMAIDCICMQLHTYVLDEVEHKLASGDIAWEFFGSNEGKFGSKDGGGSIPSPRL